MTLELWIHFGGFVIALLGLLVSIVWHCMRDAKRFGEMEGRIIALERREK